MLKLTDYELFLIRKVMRTYLVMSSPDSHDYARISTVAKTIDHYLDWKNSQADNRMDMGD